MRTVINGLQYKSNSSGIGILLRELFGRFATETQHPCQVILPQNSPDFPHGSMAQLLYAPCAYEQGLKRMMFQSFAEKKYCEDAVLLTTDSKVPFFLPQSCRLVSVITDLAVFRMSDVYQRSRALLWKAQYRYLCRRGDLFLAISEFTKREIMELLQIPEEKIRVVPCAASDSLMPETDQERLSALKAKYHLPERFVLFVGNYNPRKNLERLIRAFDRLKRETDLPHELVIAGGQGWKFDKEKALKEVVSKEAVHFIAFVPDEDMAALYSAADLFVFPTLYEGFGIPVIEAQKCGTPVLTANVSALPEVGGEGAYYVDPYSEEEMAQGIAKVLQDKAIRARLIRDGFQNAKRFSWEASAQKLNKIVEEVAAHGTAREV